MRRSGDHPILCNSRVLERLFTRKQVKRGRRGAYNFLASFHYTPGCEKTITTVPQHGEKAMSYISVSPTIYPGVRWSAVKSMLTPAKMAGDIVKPVVTGMIAAGSIALAVATGGASAAVEGAAEGATAAAADAATSASDVFFNPAFDGEIGGAAEGVEAEQVAQDTAGAAIGATAVSEATGGGTAAEGDLFADDDLPLSTDSTPDDPEIPADSDDVEASADPGGDSGDSASQTTVQKSGKTSKLGSAFNWAKNALKAKIRPALISIGLSGTVYTTQTILDDFKSPISMSSVSSPRQLCSLHQNTHARRRSQS